MTVEVDAAACAALAGAVHPPVAGAPVAVREAQSRPAADGRPAHCRIVGTVSTTIGLELRVPRRWNGKLLMQGCRALCGYHASDDCDDALARGYATLTTDTGHAGSPLDARWAAGNPQARTDYAWRAVHLVALAGKALIARATGRAPARTYHRGCSNGGRQGLLEAERWPDTFDGVVAGAALMPGDGVMHLVWSVRAARDADGRPLLTAEDLDLLHALVLGRCGDADGTVADPLACRIDPFAPEFGRGTPAERWPAAKRAAVRRIYAGPCRADGTPLTAGGPLPGSEPAWRAFVAPAGEASPFATLASDYLRALAFDVEPPAGYGVDDFDFDADPPRVLAHARDARPSGDLRAFAARGGRAIVWHGLADESVVPGHALAYARAVRARLGAHGAAAVMRLYLLPGVGHCRESPGAGRVDWLTALEDWVERDRAPDALEGRGQAPADPARAIRAWHRPWRGD